MLEAMIFSKVATVSKQTGAISFRFEKFGVPMTTFGNTTPSLDEQDDAAPPVAPAAPTSSRRMAARPVPEVSKKKKDPRIPNRLGWPEFYEQHQADMEALYELATDRSLQGSRAIALPGSDDDDNDDDDDTED